MKPDPESFLSNSVTFIENRIVEALGITVDRRPKGRPRKMER